MIPSTRFKQFIVLIVICQSILLIIYRSSLSKIIPNDSWRNLIARSHVDNLVVFNALGKPNNLALVEHARRKVFKEDSWDRVAYMFADETEIPDDNVHLKNLKDELACSIVRTPGVHWGDFLQYISPVFVANYDYVALVLDDMFLPDQGENAFNATKLIERMAAHDVQVMTPGIHGATHDFLGLTRQRNVEGCLVRVNFIETYVQIFTRDAWECYYKMFHHTGGRGWCYDMCFSKQCPGFQMAQDFSMFAWHMDRGITELPQDELFDANVTDWKPAPRIEAHGYQSVDGMAICNKLHCSVMRPDIFPLLCPS